MKRTKRYQIIVLFCGLSVLIAIVYFNIPTSSVPKFLWTKAVKADYNHAITQGVTKVQNVPQAGTGVTRSEMVEKFDRCIKSSNKLNWECARVHLNISAYWRSVSKGLRTDDEDFERMNLASQCAFNDQELMDYTPRDTPFPWEQEYLSDPPFRNMADTAWASKSSIVLKNVSKVFAVGDTLVFVITLRDGRGARRKKGGDSVRVWLKSENLGASIAADVTDQQDGSYLATTLLPWSGKVKVKATIAHTRELYRTIFYLQKFFKTTHWFSGTFSNAHASEATPCSPVAAIPAFPVKEVCNLTNENGGFSWYCGKPVKSEFLNCSDWISTKKFDNPAVYPLTEAEDELLLLTSSKRPFLIPNNISIVVQPDSLNHETLPLPALMCNKRNLSLTFEDTDQSGYFYHKLWRPLACRLPVVDREFLLNCLKDTEFLILGDSNSRLQMDILRDNLQCVDKIQRDKVVWHAPLQCDNDTIGLSVKYFPPKHPFFGSVGENLPNNVLFSAIEKLDAIPSTGSYLVMLHDFLHIVPFHFSVVENRLRLLRQAVESLLARNPHVIVIYQSAHTAYTVSRNSVFKNNVFLLELQRKWLRGLGDRVMFGLAWPLTVAAENKDGHPSVSDQLSSLFMGYVCRRW